MTTENISPASSKSHHRRNKFKKTSENISPTYPNDWSKYFTFSFNKKQLVKFDLFL